MPPTLKTKAKRVLVDRFGHKDFQKGQWEPIDAVLAGHDALVVMPTGSGKSLVYQLPALMLPGLTVVVSPLIALMKDQQDKLIAHGVDALAMHSHLTDAEARDARRSVSARAAARFSISRRSDSRIASSSSACSRARSASSSSTRRTA